MPIEVEQEISWRKSYGINALWKQKGKACGDKREKVADAGSKTTSPKYSSYVLHARVEAG